MKLTKILFCLLLLNTLAYSEALSLKGIKSGMSFNEVCESISKIELKDNQYTQKDNQCGYDKDFIAKKIQDKQHGATIEVYISNSTVDELFKTKGMPINKFAQAMVDNYPWLSTLKVIDTVPAINAYVYGYTNTDEGWSIEVAGVMHPMDIKGMRIANHISIKLFSPYKTERPKFD